MGGDFDSGKWRSSSELGVWCLEAWARNLYGLASDEGTPVG